MYKLILQSDQMDSFYLENQSIEEEKHAAINDLLENIYSVDNLLLREV